jgi:outer membrane immunogenic protein
VGVARGSPHAATTRFCWRFNGQHQRADEREYAQWLASARARLGYIWPNNMMWYATGGAAWANIEYAAQEGNLPPGFATDFRSVTSFTTTKSVWVAGGGAEWMATPNILLRGEYLYYSFNSGTNASANLFPNPGAFPVAFNYN